MLNSLCWSAMNCVLDLGCGIGLTPQKLDLPQTWRIIGLDVNEEALCRAHETFPNRVFVRGAGESMPFANETFWRIFSNVAVSYMHIPEALAEMNRVLQPGCAIVISTHSIGFTFSELRRAFPIPFATLYRIYVMANGVYFHLTGKLIRLSSARVESFQTRGAIRRALEQQGFSEIQFRFDGRRCIVEAKKKPSLSMPEACLGGKPPQFAPLSLQGQTQASTPPLP